MWIESDNLNKKYLRKNDESEFSSNKIRDLEIGHKSDLLGGLLIDPQRAIEDIMNDPNKYSRDIIQAVVFKLNENNKYMSLSKYIWREENDNKTPYWELVTRYPQLVDIAADLSFATHIPKLLHYIESGDIIIEKWDTNNIVRRKLKWKLGNTKVYRGMMLSDNDAISIKKEGLLSPLLNYSKVNKNLWRDFFENRILKTWLSKTIQDRINRWSTPNAFISTSEYKDIAIVVGAHFGNNSWQKKKLYILELLIPTIDLVFYSETVVRQSDWHTRGHLPIRIEKNVDWEKVVIDNKYEWTDTKVEQFIPWKIDHNEIVSIEVADEVSSTFRGNKDVVIEFEKWSRTWYKNS